MKKKASDFWRFKTYKEKCMYDFASQVQTVLTIALVLFLGSIGAIVVLALTNSFTY